MGENWIIKNYEVVVGEERFRVTKDTVTLLKRAMFECKTEFGYYCHRLSECFSISCWLDEYIKQNENGCGFIKGVDEKDQKEIKQIAQSLKNTSYLDFNRMVIRKKRDGITYQDLQIEAGLDAEQILENKLLGDIFKSYLKDDGLRDEVITRVQDILDLISAHLKYRQGEREKLVERKKKAKADCQQEILKANQDYLERCKNYEIKEASK